MLITWQKQLKHFFNINLFHFHFRKILHLCLKEIFKMPFVIMCGLPSSGKTFYAGILSKHLQEIQHKNVIIINDSMFCNDKNNVFMESNKEKELRASLKSEVQKFMSKEDIVILDSSNYIKGYRYELFCVSKLTQTPQCVV